MVSNSRSKQVLKTELFKIEEKRRVTQGGIYTYL